MCCVSFLVVCLLFDCLAVVANCLLVGCDLYGFGFGLRLRLFYLVNSVGIFGSLLVGNVLRWFV